MKIVEIVASAGRTFNHPYEDYSNLKPMVTLKAQIQDGEDPMKAAQDLQRAAEQLAEDQKQNMLIALRDEHEMGEARNRMIGLARQLKAAQEELDTLRNNWPNVAQLALLPENP